MKTKRARNINGKSRDTDHIAVDTARFVWKQIDDVLVDVEPGEYDISEYVKLVVVAGWTKSLDEVRLEAHRGHDVHVDYEGESYMIGANKFSMREWDKISEQFSDTNDTAYRVFGFNGARDVAGLRRTKLKPGRFVHYPAGHLHANSNYHLQSKKSSFFRKVVIKVACNSGMDFEYPTPEEINAFRRRIRGKPRE